MSIRYVSLVLGISCLCAVGARGIGVGQITLTGVMAATPPPTLASEVGAAVGNVLGLVLNDSLAVQNMNNISIVLFSDNEGLQEFLVASTAAVSVEVQEVATRLLQIPVTPAQVVVGGDYVVNPAWGSLTCGASFATTISSAPLAGIDAQTSVATSLGIDASLIGVSDVDISIRADPTRALIALVNAIRRPSLIGLLQITSVTFGQVLAYRLPVQVAIVTPSSFEACAPRLWYLVFIILVVPAALLAISAVYRRSKRRGFARARRLRDDHRAHMEVRPATPQFYPQHRSMDPNPPGGLTQQQLLQLLQYTENAQHRSH